MQKTVLVGNGVDLLGSKLGEWIDAHKEVVRVNVAPFGSWYARDVGSRITHWAVASSGITRSLIQSGADCHGIDVLIRTPWQSSDVGDKSTIEDLLSILTGVSQYVALDERIWRQATQLAPRELLPDIPSTGMLAAAYLSLRGPFDAVGFGNGIESVEGHYWNPFHKFGRTHSLEAERKLFNWLQEERIFLRGSISETRKGMG